MSDIESDGEGEQGPTLGTYEGERHPDTKERHGKGKATLPNGDTYEGSYDMGKRSGAGTYRFKKSRARYVGEYLNNKKHGFGTFHYPDGSKYEGQWFDDLRQGVGTYTYANGDTYEGQWLSNVREGEGVYTYASTGSQYVGFWSKGRRHGPGQIVHAGFRYNGTFTDDQPLGSGTYVFANKCQQAGEYVVDETAQAPKDPDEPQSANKVKWHGHAFAAVQG